MAVGDALGGAGGARAVEDSHAIGGGERNARRMIGAAREEGLARLPLRPLAMENVKPVGGDFGQFVAHRIHKIGIGRIGEEERAVGGIGEAGQRGFVEHAIQRHDHPARFQHRPEGDKAGDGIGRKQADLVALLQPARDQGIGGLVGGDIQLAPAEPLSAAHHRATIGIEPCIMVDDMRQEVIIFVMRQHAIPPLSCRLSQTLRHRTNPPI